MAAWRVAHLRAWRSRFSTITPGAVIPGSNPCTDPGPDAMEPDAMGQDAMEPDAMDPDAMAPVAPTGHRSRGRSYAPRSPRMHR